MSTAISFPYKGRQVQLPCPTLLLLWSSIRQFLAPELPDTFARMAPMPDDAVLLDIGANIGYMSVFYSFAWPKVQIHAVEASTYNYRYLENVAKDYPTITPHHFAASDRDGTIHIAIPEESQRDGIRYIRGLCGTPNSGHISVYGTSNSYAETVTAKRLDDVFERADFIKIDVEGYTLPVLRGAEGLIREHRPYLQLETNAASYAMADYTVEEMRDWLADLDYVTTYDTGPISDIMLHPKEKAVAVRSGNRYESQGQ